MINLRSENEMTVAERKRAAQRKVVRMMVPDVGQNASEKDLKTA